ncbi:MAG: 16S rRNA (uracil(1498)-N(3))-methyltransferase [Flavobacteriaceae bacterium]|nr:16S rRNA (uracil(1498)-N(3))-methyltransferase [Flavobacteriaceae bacterium]
MQQFYLSSLSKNDTEIHFDKNESKHLSKVLRKKVGDSITITNGIGYRFSATLSHVNHNACTAIINQCMEISPDPYKLHIFIAPTKSNDRMDWFVEKATEIGVHAITPIICQRSDRKVIKQERLQKIAVAAMKQSLGAYLPIIHPASDFSKSLNKVEGTACIAHCQNTNKIAIDRVSFKEKSISIFIGPEGDFTPEEIQAAANANVTAVTLGEKRLRTETAGIIACHSISLLYP